MKIENDVTLQGLYGNTLKCMLSRYISGVSLVPHIVGRPGIGKSAFTRSLVGAHEYLNMKLNIEHFVDFRSMLHTPDEIKGLYIPAPVGTNEFKEGKLLNHMISHFPDKPNTLFVFEELNAADPDVQKALLEVMLDGKINDKKLPPFTHFIATGNEKSDAKRMYDLIEPLQDRVITMRFNPSEQDVLNIISKFSLPLAQVLAANPTMLKDVMDAKGEGWSPTPRFLEFMSPMINAFCTGTFEQKSLNKYKVEKVDVAEQGVCDDIIKSMFGERDHVGLSTSQTEDLGDFLQLVFGTRWTGFVKLLQQETIPIDEMARRFVAGKVNDTELMLPIVLMGYDSKNYADYGMSSEKEAVDLLIDVINTTQISMRSSISYLNAIGERKFVEKMVVSIKQFGDQKNKDGKKYIDIANELKQYGAGLKLGLDQNF